MLSQYTVQPSSGSYSQSSGSVLFAEPPNWIERSRYKHPVLCMCASTLKFASSHSLVKCRWPSIMFFTISTSIRLLSPFLSAISILQTITYKVRGMQKTVKSILVNSRKQQIKKSKSHHNNQSSDILIGDHSNEEFDIIVDDGYQKGKELPSEISITPLQIATAEYIGTSLAKYLNIVELLVSFGANIHSASWYTTQPLPEDQEDLDAVISELGSTYVLRQKCSAKLKQLESKQYDQMSDQNERLRDDHMIEYLQQQMMKIDERCKHLMNEQKRLKEACTSKKMVNDSAYVMAMRHRQKCNDISLIEAMVKGSLVIKRSIMKSKGVGNVLSEEIIQEIVEYCNGLSLKLWDV